MEMMTMSATSTDLFDISVERGTPNYQISISTCTVKAMAAAMIIGAAAVPVSANVTSYMFERPIPYVYFIEEKSAIDTIPVFEKIQKVLNFYNLGKSHLCKITGVSRTALYAWLDGSSEPEAENFSKIDFLYSYSKELDFQDNMSIHHGFVDSALPNEEKSLYQLFVDNKDLNTNHIKELIKTALYKSISRSENIANGRKSEFTIAHSGADKELNLEVNL